VKEIEKNGLTRREFIRKTGLITTGMGVSMSVFPRLVQKAEAALTPQKFSIAVAGDPHRMRDTWINTLTEIRGMSVNPDPRFSPSEIFICTGDLIPFEGRYGEYENVFKGPEDKPLFLPVVGNWDSGVMPEEPPPGEKKGGPPLGGPPGGGRDAWIKREDKNGDGKVGPNEFGGPPEHFSQLDVNKDGFIEAREAPAGPPGGPPGGKGARLPGAPECGGTSTNAEYIRDKIIPLIPNVVRRHDKSCDYHVDHKNVRIISLDGFSCELGTWGVINKTGKEWVEETIKSAPSEIDHIFVTFHCPAFPRGRHTHIYFVESPEDRNTFWNMLIAHRDRVRAVFVGHTHHYYRVRVLDPAGAAANNPKLFPDEEGGIFQVDVGASGGRGR